MDRAPFPVPEKVVWGPQTGLGLNIPAAFQLYPGWWNVETAKYALLKVERERAGITGINDFPNGEDKPVEEEVTYMSPEARLAELRARYQK